MRLKGKAAFVTGGGSGIGRALCLALAENLCSVTVADINQENAAKVAREVTSMGCEALALAIDVTDNSAMADGFQQHLDKFHGLHIVCLNAGVMDKGNLLSSKNDGLWGNTLNINLKAQIAGTLQAIHVMEASNSQGVILYTASAGGIFPMPASPVYAASKAGLIHFARSLVPRLSKRGIRVCTLCPQVVDTPLTAGISEDVLKEFNTRFMSAKFKDTKLLPSQVAACGVALIADDSKQGTVAFIHVTGRTYEVNFSSNSLRRSHYALREGLPTLPDLLPGHVFTRWANEAKPRSVKRVQVYRLSSDFRAATQVVEEALPSPPPGHVLVRRAYAGVNASDVNFTSGRYFGSPEQSKKQLPFYAGFESVGIVAALGSGVRGLKIGDCVAELAFGTFSDWGIVSEKLAMLVPTCSAEIVALLTSGLTASIGEPSSRE